MIMKSDIKANKPTNRRQLDYTNPGKADLSYLRLFNTQLDHNKTTQNGQKLSRLHLLQIGDIKVTTSIPKLKKL